MTDAVNHPSHYNQGKIEVIEFIEDQKANFHLGNAIKYISRAGKKDPTKLKEDLDKAKWYIDRFLETQKPESERRRPNDMNERKDKVLDDNTACMVTLEQRYKKRPATETLIEFESFIYRMVNLLLSQNNMEKIVFGRSNSDEANLISVTPDIIDWESWDIRRVLQGLRLHLKSGQEAAKIQILEEYKKELEKSGYVVKMKIF